MKFSITLYKYIFLLFLLPLFITSCELDEIPDETPTFVTALERSGKQFAQDVIELPNDREYLIVGEGWGNCLDGFLTKIDALGNQIGEEVLYDNNGDSNVLIEAAYSPSDNKIAALGWSVESDENCNWIGQGTPEGVEAKVSLVRFPTSLNIDEVEETEFTNIGKASRWDAGYGIEPKGETYILTGAWGVKPAWMEISASDLAFTGAPKILKDERGEAKALFLNSIGNQVFTGKVSVNNEVKLLFGILREDTIVRQIDYVFKSHLEGISVAETNDREYIVAGIAFNKDSPTGPDNGLLVSDAILYLKKFSSDGESGIEFTFEAPSSAIDITKLGNSDEFVITGFTTVNNRKELLLLKIDANFNVLKQETYAFGENDYNVGFSVIATSDGGILAVGETGMKDEPFERSVIIVKTNMDLELFEE